MGHLTTGEDTTGLIPEGFISPDLVVVKSEATTKEEVIRQLASLLYAQGYVKDSYIDAVLKREEEFPTGLPTQGIQVALPHTDVEHCLRPGIAVATLRQPVVFVEMASVDEYVDAQLVFALSVTDPKDQVKWLKRLIIMFGHPELLAAVLQAEDGTEVHSLLREALSHEEEC